MDKIEVKVLDCFNNPGSTMMFLAKLTQRGHCIHNMKDLLNLYRSTQSKPATVEAVAALPHGTIKRFCPITVAIVGASRRFLAQARTHQVGFNYVSASLQYSDYSNKADFVVPYALIEADNAIKEQQMLHKVDLPSERYISMCEEAMHAYGRIASDFDNDTAGYVAPQGLRNILIIQANHEAWMNFIRLRSCNRNTNETQYVTLRIWEELLNTPDGKEMFKFAGPDCMFGVCKEGKMRCDSSLRKYVGNARNENVSIPRCILNEKWPLLKEVKNNEQNK